MAELGDQGVGKSSTNANWQRKSSQPASGYGSVPAYRVISPWIASEPWGKLQCRLQGWKGQRYVPRRAIL